MKKLAALFMFVLLTSGAFAQGWTFDGYFPDTTSLRYRFRRSWRRLRSIRKSLDTTLQFCCGFHLEWKCMGKNRRALIALILTEPRHHFSPIKVFVGPTFH
jgi:hypothetical protein